MVDTLITLNRPIYVTDKEQGGNKTQSPQHEEETIADASHVSKEERGLQESMHICSCIVIIKAVAKNIQTS